VAKARATATAAALATSFMAFSLLGASGDEHPIVRTIRGGGCTIVARSEESERRQR